MLLSRTWQRLHTTDRLILAAAIALGLVVSSTESPPEFKLVAYVTIAFYWVYLIGLRLWLWDSSSPRMLPLRMLITTAAASIVVYFLHNASPALLAVYLLPILFYATRFGSRAGLLAALVNFVALLIIQFLAYSSEITAHLPEIAVLLIYFVFAGHVAGSVTTELKRRTTELEKERERERESLAQLEKRESELRSTNTALAQEHQKLLEVNAVLREKERELQEAAITDWLTGLYNLRHFNRVLTIEMAKAKRYGRPISLIMSDLDNFKEVNDRFGHKFGDTVLAEVAALLLEELRQTDVLARYGGDEFTAVLPDTSAAQAALVAERIRQKIGEHTFQHHRDNLTLTISLGIAQFSGSDKIVEGDLMKLADGALYQAKRAGRNRIEVAA